MDKVRLTVMGISYNPVQNGAFALLLAEEDGPMRIPVIIGAPEAQSIAIRMEGVKPPRPLTHDLFVSFAHCFGVRLLEVFIYKFEDGIFSSEMTFSDGEREITIDARTSDAVAIAMRTGAPIFTTRTIIDTTGIHIADDATDSDNDDDNAADNDIIVSDDYNDMSVEQLEQRLGQLIQDEDYEEAALISRLINERRRNDDAPPPGNDDDDDDMPSLSDIIG